MKQHQRMSPIVAGSLACLLGGLPLLAQADDNSRYTFSGFASFGVAKSLDRDEPFGSVGDEIPYKTEYRDFNKLGLRVTADLYDNLSFTTQMVALGHNDFEPEFDWVFASYNLNPNLVLHVGKYVTSYYMYSDYSDISYAYHWVSAPDAVYGQNLNKSLDGAKLVWNARMGSWVSELSLLIGEDKADMSSIGLATDIVLQNATGLAWQIERDWLMLRASYMQSTTSAELANTQLGDNGLLTAVTPQFTAAGGVYDQLEAAALLSPSIPDEFTSAAGTAALNAALNSTSAADFRYTLGSWDKADSMFVGFGTSMNFDPLFVIAEITHVQFDDALVLGDQTAGYLTFGSHLPGNTAIALTLYERHNNTNKEYVESLTASYNQLISAAMPDAMAAVFAADPSLDPLDPADQATAAQIAGVALGAFSGALEPLVDGSQKNRRRGATLSGRWDFHSNAALKVEYLYEHYQQTRQTPNKTTPQAVRVGIDLAF